jgi:hypothetical protein
MAGVQLIYSLHFSFGYFFVVVLYLTKFFSLKYYNTSKAPNMSRTFDTPLGYPHNLVKVYLYFQLLLLCSFKFCEDLSKMVFFRAYVFYFIFIVFIIFVVKLLNFLNITRHESDLILATLTWLLVAVSGFFFTYDLLLFLLNIEVIASIYYFFFLTYISSNTITLIKFKNLISNYLWVSFFTLICYFISMLLIIMFCGSLNFAEVCTTYSKVPSFVWQLLLISFLWKIGGPGFYFFKLELYQYLPTVSLIFFSLISVFVNCFLLYYFFSAMWVIYIYYNQFLLSYLVVSNIVILLRGLTSLNFYQFLGFSAINTWSVLLVLCLV